MHQGHTDHIPLGSPSVSYIDSQGKYVTRSAIHQSPVSPPIPAPEDTHAHRALHVPNPFKAMLRHASEHLETIVPGKEPLNYVLGDEKEWGAGFPLRGSISIRSLVQAHTAVRGVAWDDAGFTVSAV